MSRREIYDILYDKLNPLPNELLKIIESYLQFLPTKYENTIKIKDTDIIDIGIDAKNRIVIFTDADIQLFDYLEPNYICIGQIDINIDEICRWSNHEWFGIKVGCNELIYIDSDLFTGQMSGIDFQLDIREIKHGACCPINIINIGNKYIAINTMRRISLFEPTKYSIMPHYLKNKLFDGNNINGMIYLHDLIWAHQTVQYGVCQDLYIWNELNIIQKISLPPFPLPVSVGIYGDNQIQIWRILMNNEFDHISYKYDDKTHTCVKVPDFNTKIRANDCIWDIRTDAYYFNTIKINTGDTKMTFNKNMMCVSNCKNIVHIYSYIQGGLSSVCGRNPQTKTPNPLLNPLVLSSTQNKTSYA